MRAVMTFSGWLRSALRAQKHECLIRDDGDEAHADRDLMSPREPGGNWHHLIRLFPDPVVVASTGPLPSATLHEIRLIPALLPERTRLGRSTLRVNKQSTQASSAGGTP